MQAARSANIGVVVVVADGGRYRLEFANERALGQLGGAPSRIPEGLRLSAPKQERLRAWLADPEAVGPLVLEGAVLGTDAEGSVVRLVASRANVRGRTAAVLFLYDVLARKRAERALEESETRFRRLLDAAPDSIAVGTRARFVYANPALVRLLGYSRMEDVTEAPLTRHVYAADMPLARHMARTLLVRGEAPPPTRIRGVRKDGTVFPLELRVIPIEWDGEPAMLGIARDLTERRRVQAQLIRADRLAAMGTLAAGVAHEINNPLAYLMLNLQYVMRELPRFDGDPARLELLLERLAEAEHGARRVSAIVGDLRTFARPEQVERGPVSVGRAVASAVKVASSQIRHRARLVEEYGAVPLVEGSATRLEQVFLNLLVNAAQAIPEGNPDANEIRVATRQEDDRVVVEIRDTGSGIAPEILNRVFDPFFTTKPRGVGTGLGLPISRGIIQALGGEIAIESVVGRGTTIRVSLPALPTADVRSSPEATAQHPLSHVSPRPEGADRSRILVVDDEPLVADMLKRTLSDAHDVTVATDAQTALEYVLAGREYDLIFCDLLMPRMSGMDLFEALRDRAPGVERRIVFMTGGAFTERAAQFLATVPNQKMSKPFDLTELERVVTGLTRSTG